MHPERSLRNRGGIALGTESDEKPSGGPQPALSIASGRSLTLSEVASIEINRRFDSMGIPDRISTLIRANINDLIDRAEDPEKMIRQLIAEMHTQLLQVKTEVAAAIADEKQLHERYQLNQERATEWLRKAELAVDKRQDALAREALLRSNAFQQTADGFKHQHDEQSRQVAVLKEALAQLEEKVSDAAAKQDLLVARGRRARAETEIRTTLSGLETGSASASFERMQDKVDRHEARAAALGELESDSVEERIQVLEAGSDVDAELAALKTRQVLAAPNGAKALDDGEPPSP